MGPRVVAVEPRVSRAWPAIDVKTMTCLILPGFKSQARYGVPLSRLADLTG